MIVERGRSRFLLANIAWQLQQVLARQDAMRAVRELLARRPCSPSRVMEAWLLRFVGRAPGPETPR